jgi:ParB family chromosome partitioning protein
MIRQLDDHALVMAQGQENTARQGLSFIEKASFTAQLSA